MAIEPVAAERTWFAVAPDGTEHEVVLPSVFQLMRLAANGVRQFPSEHLSLERTQLQALTLR